MQVKKLIFNLILIFARAQEWIFFFFFKELIHNNCS